jgi:hypothetical protein
MHRSNCVVTVCLELRNVNSTNAMRLDCINVNDEAILCAVSKMRLLDAEFPGAVTSLPESSLATDDGAIVSIDTMKKDSTGKRRLQERVRCTEAEECRDAA